MKKWCFLFLLLPAMALGQDENKIEDSIQSMMDNHPVRVGIFRVSPQLELSSGYDSNVLSQPGSGVNDYYALVAPAADVAVKLGHRAYVSFNESLNFLYYRDFDNLRDTFLDTTGQIVTGSRKLLLTVTGGYVNKKARVDYEYDIPAQEKLTTAKGELEIALREKTDLRFQAELSKSIYHEIPGTGPVSPPPPDSRYTSYGGSFLESMGRRTRFTVDGATGITRFLNVDPNAPFKSSSNFWNVLSGFEFDGKQMIGRAKAGYGRTDSTSLEQSQFKDFIVDTDFEYHWRRRLQLGVFAQRRRSVSALVQNSFILYTYGGARGSFPLSQRFFLDGKVTAGNNDYGNQPALNTSEVITKDQYKEFEGAINIVLREHLIVRFNTTHLNRDSNVASLTKDRTTFGAGLVLEP